jgi:serine-type D-Ala-D-Ala carboxypeptidase (penicillin-binding protein 5/6)
MIRTLRLYLVVALALVALPARAFETASTAAWVYDVTTQTVLMDKNADVAPAPGLDVEADDDPDAVRGTARWPRYDGDRVRRLVPRRAMGGSTMFLQESDRPTVNDLIRGMIINSGNDACVVVAEGLAGTEESFLGPDDRTRARPWHDRIGLQELPAAGRRMATSCRCAILASSPST